MTDVPRTDDPAIEYDSDGDDASSLSDADGASWWRWSLVGMIAALAVGKLAHSFLIQARLDQTAALYVGLPAVIAAITVLSARYRSATGAALVVITIGLLMALIVFGEGWICVVMAAPIFYLVGVIFGLAIDYSRRAGADDPRKPYGMLIFPAVMLASMEGTHPSLTFDRPQSVTVERVVAAGAADVEAALAGRPRFDLALPAYLRSGYPVPVASNGAGTDVGDIRSITFRGGPDGAADVTSVVAEREPGHVRFDIVSDRTPIANWLGWTASDVTWRPDGPNRTVVTWTLHYERRLDPAWYFGPWQRYAVGLAAGYMIDTAATPR